jgi:tetratricopeptide (TPR) repeat protein
VRRSSADSRADDEASTYSLRRVQAMLGLSRTVLDGLIAEGFVKPTRGRRNEWRFGFQDLMLLRTAHALQAARIPPRRILRSLARLKASLPDSLPLTGLRISAIGADVAVRSAQGQWQADSGQLLMDFDVAPVAGGQVAFIERGPARGTAGAVERGTGRLAERGPGRPAGGAPADAEAAGTPAGAAAESAAADWFARGEALEAADPAAPEAAYRRAIALAPAQTAAYLNLGAMWSEAGRHADVVALCDDAIVHCAPSPELALVHYNRAVALDHLEHLAEALASYERSLALDPTLADAHYNLGRLREQLGDHRGALRDFSAYRRLQKR